MYCKILRLKPAINKTFALNLSKYISQYAKKFGIDPTVSVAIAMQESSLENRNRMGYLLRDGKLVYGVTDVGVFQLHVRTLANLVADGHDLDMARLTRDVEYQTYWHAKILKSKIQTCKRPQFRLNIPPGNEWACYHSFTYGERNVYLGAVKRHLAKLTAR